MLVQEDGDEDEGGSGTLQPTDRPTDACKRDALDRAACRPADGSKPCLEGTCARSAGPWGCSRRARPDRQFEALARFRPRSPAIMHGQQSTHAPHGIDVVQNRVSISWMAEHLSHTAWRPEQRRSKSDNRSQTQA